MERSVVTAIGEIDDGEYGEPDGGVGEGELGRPADVAARAELGWVVLPAGHRPAVAEVLAPDAGLGGRWVVRMKYAFTSSAVSTPPSLSVTPKPPPWWRPKQPLGNRPCVETTEGVLRRGIDQTQIAVALEPS